MSTVRQEPNIINRMRNVVPAQRYSRMVKFIDEVAKDESNGPPTSVDIFDSDGKWYCQVRRGDEMTQPMGPYTKRQAERIQDARKMSIAKMGTARHVFR